MNCEDSKYILMNFLASAVLLTCDGCLYVAVLFLSLEEDFFFLDMMLHFATYL